MTGTMPARSLACAECAGMSLEARAVALAADAEALVCDGI
jgi:hypothetical protein